MGVVGGAVIRRIVDAARGPEPPDRLLGRVGLSPGVPTTEWANEAVDEGSYYELLELIGTGDDALPMRYAAALGIDDLGALGLAFKTAGTLQDALRRMARYILVLSDTVEYELREDAGVAALVLLRPTHRRGAALANECALGAVISLLRQSTDTPVVPLSVSFRHEHPASIEAHERFFGCPVTFEGRTNALWFEPATLASPTRLADDGLSMFLVARLDELKATRADRSLDSRVRAAITDALPDGRPSRSQIARRLGMSERTLHRRLSEQGETFQSIVTRSQRTAAESLLANGRSSLADVAFLTGFSDQSAFTRAFKGWTGQTPLAFREAGSA